MGCAQSKNKNQNNRIELEDKDLKKETGIEKTRSQDQKEEKEDNINRDFDDEEETIELKKDKEKGELGKEGKGDEEEKQKLKKEDEKSKTEEKEERQKEKHHETPDLTSNETTTTTTATTTTTTTTKQKRLSFKPPKLSSFQDSSMNIFEMLNTNSSSTPLTDLKKTRSSRKVFKMLVFVDSNMQEEYITIHHYIIKFCQMFEDSGLQLIPFIVRDEECEKSNIVSAISYLARSVENCDFFLIITKQTNSSSRPYSERLKENLGEASSLTQTALMSESLKKANVLNFKDLALYLKDDTCPQKKSFLIIEDNISEGNIKWEKSDLGNQDVCRLSKLVNVFASLEESLSTSIQFLTDVSRMEHDQFHLQHKTYKNYLLKWKVESSHIEKINSHFDKNDSPLVICSKNPTFNTCLLANFIQSCFSKESAVFYHFNSCSTESLTVENIMKRFLAFSKFFISQTDSYPTDASRLNSQFLSSAGRMKEEMDVVFAIDGLSKEHFGLFLPLSLMGIKLVITTSNPSDVFPEDVKIYRCEDNLIDAVESLCSSYRSLPSETIEKLKLYRNDPLLLDIIVNLYNLRVVSDEQVAKIVKLKNEDEIVEVILEVFESKHGVNIVERCLSTVCCSRTGLTVFEINEVLKIGAIEWCEIWYSLGNLFLQDSGLIVLKRSIFQHAIHQRYFKSESKATLSADLLIDYFQKRSQIEMSYTNSVAQRTIHELLFFLMATDKTEELKKAISNLSFFEKMVVGENSFDLRIYWNYIGWKPEIVGQALVDSIEQAEKKFKSAEIEEIQVFSDRISLAAGFLRECGFLQYSLHLYKKLLPLREKIYGKEHLKIASTLNSMALLFKQLSSLEECESFHLKALEIRVKLVGENHPSVGEILNNLGLLYRQRDQLEEAEKMYLKSLEIRRICFGDNHQLVGQSLNNLALLYKTQGRLEEAEKMYLESLETRKLSLGENHPDVAQTLNNLALLYKQQKRHKEAEEMYIESLGIKERMLGDSHPDVARTLNNIGLLYKEQGDLQKAEIFYERCLAIREKALGLEHPDTLITLGNFAEFQNAKGNKTQALEMHTKVLEARRKVLGGNHPDVAVTCSNMSMIYEEMDQMANALEYARLAAEIRTLSLGENHVKTKQSWEIVQDIELIIASKT